jgi:hypothetical protein
MEMGKRKENDASNDRARKQRKGKTNGVASHPQLISGGTGQKVMMSLKPYLRKPAIPF